MNVIDKNKNKFNFKRNWILTKKLKNVHFCQKQMAVIYYCEKTVMSLKLSTDNSCKTAYHHLHQQEGGTSKKNMWQGIYTNQNKGRTELLRNMNTRRANRNAHLNLIFLLSDHYF